jgi:tetratricopeptide (TPR) repeat protein
MVLLFVVLEQTTIERPSAVVTIKRFRYSEWRRLSALIALVVLPCVTSGVMWVGYMRARRLRRRQVPGRLKAGLKHFIHRELDAALREYDEAIAAAPEHAEAYCRRGLVYNEMGKTEQALADLDNAIRCDPRFSPAYLERGKLRTAKGDFDGALADFGQLMVTRADDPDTHLQRGVCFVKKGLFDDAIADFYRVLKLTNHSDYAEPAKAYIRQVLDDKAGAAGRYRTNGVSSSSLPPRLPAQDQPL